MENTNFSPRQPIRREYHPSIVPYYLGHFLIYLGLLIVSLVVIWLLLKANRIYTNYQIITQQLNMLESNSAETTPAQLQESFETAATGVETLAGELGPFLALLPYLGWIPGYGGDLQAVPALLPVAQDLSRAGLIVNEAFSPLLRSDLETGQVDPLPQVIDRLREVDAELQQVESRLQLHQATLNQLDVDRLSPGVAGRVNQLNQYLPEVLSGLQLIRGLPTLLGATQPKTYLILTQNSDELRPTGGYINAAGHIVFNRGRIVEFVIQDSYDIDQISEAYPYPPRPIYQYMAADYWVLRDASWSPDFPTAARVAIDLYELGQGISADGVIALDQYALPYLLKALGPLMVEGERVTGDNVIALMRQKWAPEEGQSLNRDWWWQRKSFMLSLGEIIQQRFVHNPGAINMLALAQASQQALAEKHILIYLEDPPWLNVLNKRKFDGALQPVTGDYLMVNDANLGFNKASAIVDRHVKYDLQLAKDGSAKAHVELRYQHPAPKQADACSQEPRYDPVYEQNMARCYWNYVRLVVPADAELQAAPAVQVPGQYLLRGQPTTGQIDVERLGADKIGWGQLFVLAPQESIVLDYVYTRPPGAARPVEDHWEYDLYLQKQPGTLEPGIDVKITLPQGARLLDSEPLPAQQQQNSLSYLLNLKTDQQISIAYSQP